MNQEETLRQELNDLQKKLQEPAIYSSKEYPRLAKRQAELAKLIELYNAKQQKQKELSDAKADPELAELISELEEDLISIETSLAEALTPKDLNDERDCIIEIRAAAGGDESSLFAGELYRMYARWCETHGYKVELLGQSPSEAGGYKEISFEVHGTDAYKNL